MCMDGLRTAEFLLVLALKTAQLYEPLACKLALYVFSLLFNQCSLYLWCIVYQANKLFNFIFHFKDKGISYGKQK